MPKRTTSRDVAARAGVSQSTVSHVLTGKTTVTDATRQRVLAAMEELRYRPNLAARSMRTRKSGRLAVVMPLTTPSIGDAISGAAEAAQEAGYVLELQGLTGTAEARKQRLLEIAGTGEFEGILSFMSVPGGDDLDEHTTVFALSAYDENLHVSGEMAEAGAIAEIIETLATQGHRRFLHIAGPEDYASALARRAAYESTIARLGLDSLGVIAGDWSGDSGERALRTLPDDTPPVAIIASNDLVAAGAIRGAHARGWTVPGQVSVSGWDDLDLSAFLDPSLTTVALDRQALGRHAVHRLLAKMRGEAEPERAGSLARVVWRESTGTLHPSD
ncbi:LacI family DNA-binding transcriptional regulator [Microbacterium amylolyticum]|uniref:DNA-binding LacI/PurR family transcriptional regulator n=1 Tax=Microbacterium amylolyticum TaxID=936337 RepID=A0ABS4ZIS4_9MICO|nr:LacI family DNA-binding transcriptional regulator [Microbacterium amylolyticum]MBP2437180.1 DNA-binding LacI/PurR family transcriptional regulator [Microbacterium amylolyticum]